MQSWPNQLLASPGISTLVVAPLQVNPDALELMKGSIPLNLTEANGAFAERKKVMGIHTNRWEEPWNVPCLESGGAVNSQSQRGVRGFRRVCGSRVVCVAGR